MTDKPTLTVDLDLKGAGALPALDRLSVLDESKFHHDRHDLRHPLGIYNVSVARVCDKLIGCAKRLELVFRRADTIVSLQALDAEIEEVVDYIELSLYAAAEHVDDVECIALCSFPTRTQYKKSAATRDLLRAIKKIRDRITAIANALKHHQARIRLYALEFIHDGKPMCFHGLFIEQFSGGKLGPSPILHAGVEKIISVPSFLWDIAVYLFEMSQALSSFLEQVHEVGNLSMEAKPCGGFARACTALARLPNYSMDGAHPFERVEVLLTVATPEAKKLLESGLYGSVRTPWSKSQTHAFGGFILKYSGDGVSRSFALVQPTRVALQHWG